MIKGKGKMKKLFFVCALVLFPFMMFGQEPPQTTPIAPTITWTPPKMMRVTEALSGKQLNAYANVPGAFVYTPAAGTTLSVGDGQTLSLVFTPHDTAKFSTANATAQIDVKPEFWPYDPSEAAYICHVNPNFTAIVDPETSLPRCFVVPVPVSQSITRHMLSQTTGLDAQGNVTYKYASWWDFIIKFFINSLVNPMLDQYPPPDVAKAKEAAKAAAEAVDSAKAAILAGQSPQ
jgi:hypothetical protein